MIYANGNGIVIRAFLSLILGLLLTSGAAAAGPCEDIEDGGAFYTVCAFDARAASVRLFLRDVEGGTIGSFSRLSEVFAERGERLVFAMNAGMYREDYSPVGLYVEGGTGISVSSISAIPARSAREGATMARRSLAHSSQADL